MRAVNLIPADQRSGAQGRSGGAVYVVLGVLALVVVMAGAYVLSSTSLENKRADLADTQQRAQAAEARAGSLQPYTGGGTAAAAAPPAAATQSSTASLPPGASVGSAGFPTMPFKFVFNGSYFEMERMLDEINRFVSVRGDRVDVRGRLLSIDGIALQAGPQGFPSVKASISATAYLVSPDQGPTCGATPAGPSGSGGSSAPYAAVVGQAP